MTDYEKTSELSARRASFARDWACIRHFLHRNRGGNARGKPTCIRRLEIYFSPRWHPDKTASSRAPRERASVKMTLHCINSHTSAMLFLSASREIILFRFTWGRAVRIRVYWSRRKSQYVSLRFFSGFLYILLPSGLLCDIFKIHVHWQNVY